MINKPVKQVNTKLVISELHRAFKLFNDELFKGNLPEPAIIIQSKGNKKLTLGWCTVRKEWNDDFTQEDRYEINLVAEALNRGTLPVMATLLHEMVHLHNLVNGIKDTSRSNTYHNMKFKKTAEEHGLKIEYAKKIGWSVILIQDKTLDLIKSANFDEAVFSLGRKDFSVEDIEKKKSKSSSRKYVCPECGTIIRASKDVFVLCGICTNVEEGKIVPMIKEHSKCEADSPIAEAPIKEPEAPAEEEKVETYKEVVEIVEVDDVLLDGDGNPIPVKQGMINIKKEWTAEDIADILKETKEEAESLGLEAPPFDLPIEINPKMVAQFALYKEGKNITFSKNYLSEASDEEIIDTIKHQYLHHYEFMVNGLKVNHKKPFKSLCEQFGIETKVPLKNHRAMK